MPDPHPNNSQCQSNERVASANSKVKNGKQVETKKNWKPARSLHPHTSQDRIIETCWQSVLFELTIS